MGNRPVHFSTSGGSSTKVRTKKRRRRIRQSAKPLTTLSSAVVPKKAESAPSDLARKLRDPLGLKRDPILEAMLDKKEKSLRIAK